jgi:hypothetical protein
MAIGPWDQVLAFVAELRKRFAQWTGHNNGYHLSVGVAIGHASRPVMAALEEAEAALRCSKQRAGKASITLLGSTFTWDEYTSLMSRKDLLATIVRGESGREGTARQLLHRMQTLPGADQWHRIPWGPHIWRTHYYLKQFAGRHDVPQQQINGIEEQLLTKEGVALLRTAARLAEFETSASREE